MADAPLFSVPNHQSEDCGKPPVLPTDFNSRPYRRSYFENHYGEQWLFWYDMDTKETHIYGGDCGWDMSLTAHRVLTTDLLGIFRSLGDNMFAQMTLAGKVLTPQRILGSSSNEDPKTTMIVVNSQEHLVTLNGEEYVWLEACLMSLPGDVPILSKDHLRRILTASHNQAQSKDPDSDGARKETAPQGG